MTSLVYERENSSSAAVDISSSWPVAKPLPSWLYLRYVVLLSTSAPPEEPVTIYMFTFRNEYLRHSTNSPAILFYKFRFLNILIFLATYR